jgi:hypothetical protein
MSAEERTRLAELRLQTAIGINLAPDERSEMHDLQSKEYAEYEAALSHRNKPDISSLVRDKQQKLPVPFGSDGL